MFIDRSIPALTLILNKAHLVVIHANYVETWVTYVEKHTLYMEIYL